MPPFLAIFFSVEGVPATVGLYTIEEFAARYNAAEKNTAWAFLIETKTGRIVHNRQAASSEKTI